MDLTRVIYSFRLKLMDLTTLTRVHQTLIDLIRVKDSIRLK